MADPSKKRRMEEGDAAAGMAKLVAGLPAQRDPVAETREQLAYLIRAELVCCDIYEKLTFGTPDNREFRRRKLAARMDHSYHDICYFGEWSARLCLTGKLPPFPLIYTRSLNGVEWEEILVQPGPVRIATVFPKAERPKRLKKMLAGEEP